MTKEMLLTKGRVVLVDDDEFERLKLHKYCLSVSGRGKCYAIRRQKNGKNILMHDEIMTPPLGMEVDHINGDGLDNQRCNLRLCDRSQNMANQKKTQSSASMFKGVARYKDSWQSRIQVRKETIYLGHFEQEVDAARAYDSAASHFFGTFASLNFPNDIPTPYIEWEKTKTSKYRGVSIRANGSWKAQIGYKGDRIHLGYFILEIDAARAYDCKAKELFGEYANLNFPEGSDASS